jgi:hypothetical protein
MVGMTSAINDGGFANINMQLKVPTTLTEQSEQDFHVILAIGNQ